MRRSIERVEAQIWQSREAILESREMLERLRRGHFCYAWHGTRGLPSLPMARLWRSSQPQRPVSIDCAADLTPGSKSRARPVTWPPRVAAKRHGVDIVYSSSDRTMPREPLLGKPMLISSRPRALRLAAAVGRVAVPGTMMGCLGRPSGGHFRFCPRRRSAKSLSRLNGDVAEWL